MQRNCFHWKMLIRRWHWENRIKNVSPNKVCEAREWNFMPRSGHSNEREIVLGEPTALFSEHWAQHFVLSFSLHISAVELSCIWKVLKILVGTPTSTTSQEKRCMHSNKAGKCIHFQWCLDRVRAYFKGKPTFSSSSSSCKLHTLWSYPKCFSLLHCYSYRCYCCCCFCCEKMKKK